jgi:cytochrome c peroxidase
MSAAKATLGKLLFWDEQMSSTGTVACGTCHRPAAGGSDPRTLVNNPASANPGFDGIFNTPDDVAGSPGVPLNDAGGLYNWSNTYGMRPQVTPRKSPTFIDAVYSPFLFLDGRANGTFRDPVTNAVISNAGAALENQAVNPPVSDSEMGHTGTNWPEVAQQISSARPLALSPNVSAPLQSWIGGRGYPELFQEVFGTPEVTPARIAMAIATYERTLFSDRTPLDMANSGIGALTPQEQRGFDLFTGNDCRFCHADERLTDDGFHFIGVRPQSEDPGRFAVTGNNNNRGEFRTPSLRNVELRGPYMHDGRFATLEEVVEFYNRGGDFPQGNNFPGGVIRPRNLTAQQKADLVAFLKRPLTDPRVAGELPPFDRPGLYTESARVPVITGTGTAGSGGIMPQAIAIEPPIVGNPSFTVSVSGTLGGASGVLVIDSSDPGNTPNIPPAGSFARTAIQANGNGNGAGYASLSLPIPNNPALVGQTFFGRWYITDPGSAAGVAVSQAFRFTVFGEAAAVPMRVRADFDWDGKSDLSVYRASDSNWYVFNSGGGTIVRNWGLPTDVLTPGDFDGDGKADAAAYRPSTGQWYVLRSSDSSVNILTFGVSGDIPAAGDYDGDGKADEAVFRPSTGVWYVYRSSDGGVSITAWGASGDVPVASDYDGDGKYDVGVFRPSNGVWYVYRTTAGPLVATWGVSTDKPVQADYDGDGKADLAIYRPSEGNWYVYRSTDNSVGITNWGNSTDIPAPGDFDGDGKYDYTVFRDGTWYIYESTSGPVVATWGIPGDVPIPAKYIPGN